MFEPKIQSCQSGVALIVSLLLLFVLTLVAVASFSTSHVQERAASNARLQTMAFEAAAAGASHSIDFFLENVAADAPDTLCGKIDHLGWGTDNPTQWREPSEWRTGTTTYPITVDGAEIHLHQRMYCLNDEYPCNPSVETCETGARPPRSQLFVASRGEVEANGRIIAIREVEVRIDRRNDVYEIEGCGAICFAACEANFYTQGNRELPALEFPASNAFTVNGGGGPAVTTGKDCTGADPDLYDLIMDDIEDSRIGNYDGEVHRSDPGEPFNQPSTTELFRSETQIEAIDRALSGDPLKPGFYIDGNFVPPADIGGEFFPDARSLPARGSGVYVDNGNTVYGTLDNPAVVYVDGDIEFGGGISGAGIIMVEGNISWSGTPDFKGLIVSLGGSYTIDGGGLGGVHAGSVVVINHDSHCDPCNDPFGPVSWMNEGGGTAEYTWDCTALQTAFAQVDDAFGADDLWGLDCERGPPTLVETPGELVVKSWRENIGWREEYFSSN